MQLELSKKIDYALLWRLEVAGVPQRWQWRPRDWRRFQQDELATVGVYRDGAELVAALALLRQPPRARGLKCDSVEVLRLIVAPGLRRRGIGRSLLTSLHRNSAEVKAAVVATVPEELVDVQQFLQSCGWLAVGMVPSLDDDLGNAIRFRAGD